MVSEEKMLIQRRITMARSFLPELLERPLSQFPNLWRMLEGDTTSEDFGIGGLRIYEENNQLHVEVPLPGLNPNDIEVSLSKGILWIKGETKEEEKNKNKKFYRFAKRSYSSSVALPVEIDDKQDPQATYQDGILKISLQLPKQGETKRITVTPGNSKKQQ